MARSFANDKLFSAIFIDGFSNSLAKRGYAAAAAAVKQTTAAATRGVVSTKSGEDKGTSSSSSSKVSWVPDPVTGYYKPENIKEIDAADLRATLLSRKFNN